MIKSIKNWAHLGMLWETYASELDNLTGSPRCRAACRWHTCLDAESEEDHTGESGWSRMVLARGWLDVPSTGVCNYAITKTTNVDRSLWSANLLQFENTPQIKQQVHGVHFLASWVVYAVLSVVCYPSFTLFLKTVRNRSLGGKAACRKKNIYNCTISNWKP